MILVCVFLDPVYLICQRYKFKSKSQLYQLLFLLYGGVFDMSKIQI